MAVSASGYMSVIIDFTGLVAARGEADAPTDRDFLKFSGSSMAVAKDVAESMGCHLSGSTKQLSGNEQPVTWIMTLVGFIRLAAIYFCNDSEYRVCLRSPVRVSAPVSTSC